MVHVSAIVLKTNFRVFACHCCRWNSKPTPQPDPSWPKSSEKSQQTIILHTCGPGMQKRQQFIIFLGFPGIPLRAPSSLKNSPLTIAKRRGHVGTQRFPDSSCVRGPPAIIPSIYRPEGEVVPLLPALFGAKCRVGLAEIARHQAANHQYCATL